MTYEVIKNEKTGSQFIVFAKGLGLLFAVRAWVDSTSSESGQPTTELAMRFRVERDGEVTSDGIHVGQAVQNLFPLIMWGNGDATYRSAVAKLKVLSQLNGSVLVNYFKNQGVLSQIYKCWAKALSEAPGVKVTLSEDEFVNAIVTTMEGALDSKTDCVAQVPFKKTLTDLILNEIEDAVIVDPNLMKNVGLN